MKTSKEALEKIAVFEGNHLQAYLDPLNIPTIGVGHTAGVKMGDKITYEQSMKYFAEDIRSSEVAVEKLGLPLDQGKFDGLVSFCYNCGPGNLQKLCKGRTLSQIADAIPLYNKGKNRKTGKMEVLPGLVTRRGWERERFLAGGLVGATQKQTYNPYPIPDKTLRRGSKGVCVRWVQRELIERGYGILCDGIYGPKTEACVRDYQNQRDLTADGIVGPLTRAALESGK